MNFLAPAFLAFVLLAIPIILLYMLKLRRQDRVVSSTSLWQQILRDQQANAPFQRLRVQILLLIQLLILATLVAALIRPAVSEKVSIDGPTIILLDASASMNATDITPDRFSKAKSEAQSIIDEIPQNIPVSLILAGVVPHIQASNEPNHQKLSALINTAQADQGPADWESAFYLVSNLAARLDEQGETHCHTVIISDGGFDSSIIPEIKGNLKTILVGSDKENMGITALSVRAAADGLQLFSSIKNFGEKDHPLVFTAYVDDQLIDSRQLTMHAGQQQDIVLSGLKAGVKKVNVKISSPSGETAALDSFALDNSATTFYHPVSGGKVLIVTKGNVFLQQLFEKMSDIDPYVLKVNDDGSVPDFGDSYDLYVFDGVQPAQLPTGNIVWINPPGGTYFQVQGSSQTIENVQVIDHAISRYVDWNNIHISKAEKITPPSWAEPVIQFKAGENDGHKMVVLSFDLHDSDLPMQVPFPILFSNIVKYLTTQNEISIIKNDPNMTANVIQGTNLQIQPGGKIQISPNSDIQKAMVTLPDGSQQEINLTQGKAEFSQTTRTGVYIISYPQSPDLKDQAFAVNLFNSQESDIKPREFNQTLTSPGAENKQTLTINHEYWPWFAAIALVLACFEWFLYRSFQVPRKLKPKGSRQP